MRDIIRNVTDSKVSVTCNIHVRSSTIGQYSPRDAICSGCNREVIDFFDAISEYANMEELISLLANSMAQWIEVGINKFVECKLNTK